MLSSILKEAGYRVGLYTSPHLNDFRERIRILDQERNKRIVSDIFQDAVTQDELVRLVVQNKKVIDGVFQDKDLGRLTFYEVLTALSFMFFKEQECDWVVLETGLGGRLDATNICRSKVAVLTSISLEHTHILGKTITEIAKEKSGIIKNGSEVVIAAQTEDAEQVFLNRCFDLDIEPRLVTVTEEEEQLVHQIFSRKFSLRGMHQAQNALTVLETIGALDEMGCVITEDHIIDGFKNVYWPIRFEQISKYPVLILDGAHDVASMRALKRTLLEEFPDYSIRCLFGMSEDKNREVICMIIDQFADMVVATSAEHPRAHEFQPEEMTAFFPDKAHFIIKPVRQALDFTMDPMRSNELLVVTGSMFVAAEARRELNGVKKTDLTA